MWAEVQEEIKRRAEAKGNVVGNTDKYTKRYLLTGMLYSKCGFSLRRRIINGKLNCKKVIWQCSNYIINGREACTGTVIDDEIIGRINIKKETIVREDIKNGKKHYSYSSKRK